MVRRGDYLKHPHIHNPCGMDYYNKAMQLMGEREYYVTGDDLDYCREHFPQATVLDLDEITTFYYGQLFRYFIISNSSFHWFITYLAKDVTKIYAPDKWLSLPEFAHCPLAYTSIYRDDMHVLNRQIDFP